VVAIEFDVHLCSDSAVVVHHDYKLNPRITRDQQGQWLAHSNEPLTHMSLAKIRVHDVGCCLPGSAEANEYPNYQPQDHEPVPTLSEFLTVLAETAGTPPELWIELKTSPFDRGSSSDPDALLNAVFDLIRGAGFIHKLVLLAFEWDLLGAAKRLDASVQTDYLTLRSDRLVAMYKPRVIEAGLLFGAFQPINYGGVAQAIAAAGGSWWGPYIGDVTSADIVAAQALGLRVNCWGVHSTAAAIDAALELGSDAITVADPALAQTRMIDR
jgi:glycerophosphoryl diester phosphodiesterase